MLTYFCPSLLEEGWIINTWIKYFSLRVDLDLPLAGQVLHDIMSSLVALSLDLELLHLLLHSSQ